MKKKPVNRRRQEKWDALHVVTASTRLTTKENALLEAFCIKYRITRYRALKDAIALYLVLCEKEGFPVAV